MSNLKTLLGLLIEGEPLPAIYLDQLVGKDLETPTLSQIGC